MLVKSLQSKPNSPFCPCSGMSGKPSAPTGSARWQRGSGSTLTPGRPPSWFTFTSRRLLPQTAQYWLMTQVGVVMRCTNPTTAVTPGAHTEPSCGLRILSYQRYCHLARFRHRRHHFRGYLGWTSTLYGPRQYVGDGLQV